MQNTSPSTRRTLSIGGATLIIVFICTMLLLGQFSAAPIAAQDVQPTFTPADQLTRAFDLIRNALEARFNVSLRPVSRYEWEQVEFVNGIDDCTTTVEEPRALYYGWRFVITALDGRQFEGRSSFDGTIITTCDSVTQGSTAPAPSGNLPAPVAGSAAVGAFELGGHVLNLSPSTAALANRAGMDWVKIQYRYSLGEDPSVVAGLINNARANGFKILLAIPGNISQMGDYNSYITSYANFVGGVAALGADAIEVWNEPNIDREWPVGQINGATYTQLLAAAYNAIKSRNGNTLSLIHI